MPDAVRKHLDRWLADHHAAVLGDHPALARRIDTHFDDFFAAYRRLYGHLPDTENRITRIFGALIDGFKTRRASLRAKDEERESHPGWFQDSAMVGMMMYVDLFADTIDGVYQRVEYLSELGITYLHLMPLLQTRSGANDGGYAVSDFRRVNPDLGSMRELRKLAQRLHNDGISLVIDFVMNHTAREHAWAQKALRGSTKYQEFYLMFDDRNLPDSYERTLPDVFPDFSPGNFTFLPELQKWVWTTFYDFQWDLNYQNPAVFEAMFSEMAFLANAGVDVLRMDAVPFTWKRLGTNCQNQIEAVLLLVAYRALMRMFAPGVAFKAEAIVAPNEIIRYLGVGGHEGRACDIAYNATLMNHLWHALASENTRLLGTTLSNLPPAPAATTWINYIRSHDDIGWGISNENAEAVGQSGRETRRFCTDFYSGRHPDSWSEGYRFQTDPTTGEARISGTAAALTGLQKAIVEGDAAASEAALARLLLLNGIVFFMRGIPLLYSGDEFGQLNDYSYLDDPHKRNDNRWVHRPPMDWARAARRHVPGSIEHRLFKGIQRLSSVRKSSHALHGYSTQNIVLVDNDSLFVVERTYDGDAVLLAANLSSRPQRVDLGALPPAWQNGRFHELTGDEPVTYSAGDLALSPYECLWLAHQQGGTPSKTVPVDLKVRVETQFGEMIYICGNIPELGEWRMDRAIGPLSARDYPWWTGSVLIPEGTVFNYTWVKKRGDELVETGSDTRFLRARKKT